MTLVNVFVSLVCRSLLQQLLEEGHGYLSLVASRGGGYSLRQRSRGRVHAETEMVKGEGTRLDRDGRVID